MRISAALEQGAAYDRRRHIRYSVHTRAGFSDNARPAIHITVTDLSSGGCGIEVGQHLEAGSRVWLKLPGLENWPCRVAWAREGRAGLTFDNPLHPAVVGRYSQA